MSLVDLAKSKKLPRFQYMDQQTLDWICINKPKLGVWEYKKDLFCIPLDLKEIPLETNWFLEPKTIDGIHGIRHAVRVSIYANALAILFKLSATMRYKTNIAALLHDVRRQDDKGDIGHGDRCAEWIDKNFKKINYLQSFEKRQIQPISRAVKFHEIPYDQIVVESDYKTHSRIIDIIKTSDALDRYRLPQLKWWIDDIYLKIKPTEDFKAFAFDLVTTSERNFLQGQDNVSSIKESLKALKIPI